MSAILSLNRNEYFFDHHPDVIKALIPPFEECAISHYAKQEELLELKKSLSQKLHVETDKIMLAHGAEDVFVKLLCYLRKGFRTVVVEDFSWTNYLHIAHGFSYDVVHIPTLLSADRFAFNWDGFRRYLSSKEPAIVFITSPNNPTGHSVSLSELHFLVSDFPDHMFILDSVYNDIFCDAYQNLFALQNLIFIGSFSKFFGMPGLRLGYAVGNLPSAFQLNLGLQPSAIQAALAALANMDWYAQNRAHMLAFTKDLCQRDLKNVLVYPSDAPFFLARISNLNPERAEKAEASSGVRPKYLLKDGVHYVRFGLGPDVICRKILMYLDAFQSP